MPGNKKHIPVVYYPQLDSSASQIIIQDEEAHHLLNVLRVRPNAPVEVTNGAGKWATGKVHKIQKKTVVLELSRHYSVPRQPPFIHLIVSPIRPNRMEWLMEKATELGIVQFTPLRTRHTTLARFNRERMIRIAISALKQSRQSYLPTIDTLQSWDSWVATHRPASPDSVGIVAHPGPASHPLTQILPSTATHFQVVIGPEGGLTEEEVTTLQKIGFIPTTLNHTILRTETAALTAIAQLKLLFL